ncbi:MAG: hypothetical protein LUQ07_00600 [Methanospirillum sp.]|nr:hypothetical protein [Methanospirillum sp.]
MPPVSAWRPSVLTSDSRNGRPGRDGSAGCASQRGTESQETSPAQKEFDISKRILYGINDH